MKRMIILVAVASALTLTLSSAMGDDAKAIYEKQCAKCHGPDGKGDTKLGKKAGVKDYTDAKVQADLKEDAAIKAIKEGLKDGDKTLMKPTEGLGEADIKALIAHMRSFKK